MANETIEKLHNWTPEKMIVPACGQHKLDGVPVRIYRAHANEYRPLTRQGELIRSIPHIVSAAMQDLLDVGGSIVGELYIHGKPFKEISGKVRKHTSQPDLVMYVFDYDCEANPAKPYGERRQEFANRLADLLGKLGKAANDLPIRLIPGVNVMNADAAQGLFDQVMEASPNAEGMVFHSLGKPFQPGKRVWTTQRMKPVPTIDLKIVGFEEAIEEKTGRGNGMVGRLNAEFTKMVDGKHVTTVIGIGPGALNHHQRKALWFAAVSGRYIPQIAEIKYMRDETYDALRQPTFVRWRTDKEVADVV